MKKNYVKKTCYPFFFCLLLTQLLVAQQPQVEGRWSEPIGFGLVPVAVANLPDGNLIAWSSKFRNSFGGADGFTYYELFDPLQGSDGRALGFQQTTTNHDMFCPGINNLPDGRLLVTGGSSSPKSTLYDYRTNSWLAAPNMNVARGYQASVTLSDGSAMTFGGSWSGGIGNNGEKIAEVWKPETGWQPLPGIPSNLLWNQNDANLENRGIYRLDNHAWLWLAPNGDIFHAGPGETMHWLNTRGSGSFREAGKRGTDDYSMKGTSVMFDIGKILTVGGARSYDSGDPAKDDSFVIDINNVNSVGVTPTANKLAFSRTMHNSVVLPNGEVVVTGGLSRALVFTDAGARFRAEIYNPETNRWRTAAGMQVPRTYHSVSILLPDGRVFVGGGGLTTAQNGTLNHFDAEIYSPPYLFDQSGNLAQRPTISAPETASYSQKLRVTGSGSIQEFAFVRMSSATHSTNNEQRRIPVSFSNSGGGTYDVDVPTASLLPPGYYMLFAMDANGVPSFSEIVRVGSSSTDTCSVGNNGVIPEYNVNGAWQSGQNAIEVDGGADIILSGLPNTNSYTIIDPSGATFADNYRLDDIDASKAGLYTVRNQLGCTSVIEIRIKGVRNCSGPRAVIPEYNIDGVWRSGQNVVQVDAGDTILLSGLPNTNDYLIVGPSGDRLPDDYRIDDISVSQGGVYTIQNQLGCTTTIDVRVRPNSNPNPGNNDNLLIDFSFDEQGGDTVFDSSGNNNNGIIKEFDDNGNPRGLSIDYWNESGIEDGALQMNGLEHNSNSILEIPASPTLSSLREEITVMAWVNRNTGSIIPQNGRISNVSIFAHDYPSFFFGFHNSLYKLEFYTDTGERASCYVGENELGEWVHIVGTYDGSVAKLYVDGNEICSRNLSGNLRISSADNRFGTFTISGFYEFRNSPVVSYGNASGVTDELDGRIDNFKLYNTALTQSEIRAIYDEEKPDIETIVDCAGADRVIPEYNIDGIWRSGQNVIEVDAGDTILLSALPNTNSYTIIGPSGSSFQDNYRLEDINTSEAGVYTVQNQQGCTTTIEVRVNQPAPSPDLDNIGNLALRKPTAQSSTRSGGESLRAVDGNGNGTYSAQSVTHTNRDANAWWRVDLGKRYKLSKINVFNRTDCCSSRLNGARVYIGNKPSTNPSRYRLAGTLNSDEEQSFNITRRRKARYVMVRHTRSDYLSLAEVQVFGTEIRAARTNLQVNLNSEIVSSVSPNTTLPTFTFGPNPSTDEVEIIVSSLKEDARVNYSIYSLTGQRILSREGGIRETISLKGLAKGTYVMRLDSGNWSLGKQLIVK